MISQGMAAATAAAIYRVGETVTFSRWTGGAPNGVQSPSGGAAVTAKVSTWAPDTTQTAASGLSASQVGSIPEGARFLLVMAADLAAAGFPLPVMKGDWAVLASTGEQLTITHSDPHKRQIAGAIEIWGVGVA